MRLTARARRGSFVRSYALSTTPYVAPPGIGHEIPLWIRDGWGADEKNVISDARAAGSDSPVIHLFMPKSRAEALARVIAARSAAQDTLEYKGVPSTPEGIEARQGMETRLTEATNSRRMLVAEVIDGAKVFQGGGTERLEATLLDKVREAARASLDRLFYVQGRRRPPLAEGDRACPQRRRAPPGSAGLQRQDRRPPGLLRGVVFRWFREEGQGRARPLPGTALWLVA